MSDVYSVVALAAIVACSSVFEPGCGTFDIERREDLPQDRGPNPYLFYLMISECAYGALCCMKRPSELCPSF